MLKMPFIFTQTICLSFLQSDIPKTKCSANVLCEWRPAASEITIRKRGGSLQSRTPAQGERGYLFVSQNKAELQHFKQVTWSRFYLIHRICHRTGRVMSSHFTQMNCQIVPANRNKVICCWHCCFVSDHLTEHSPCKWKRENLQRDGAPLVAQLVKNLPAGRETWVRSLGWEISWRRERLPTPVFWPGEFHGL